MPEFATPYSVKRSERKLTNEELIRAIRFSIAGEYEAIQLYEEIAETIDNEESKRLFKRNRGRRTRSRGKSALSFKPYFTRRCKRAQRRR